MGFSKSEASRGLVSTCQLGLVLLECSLLQPTILSGSSGSPVVKEGPHEEKLRYFSPFSTQAFQNLPGQPSHQLDEAIGVGPVDTNKEQRNHLSEPGQIHGTMRENTPSLF